MEGAGREAEGAAKSLANGIEAPNTNSAGVR